jgi:hypothetical protein
MAGEIDELAAERRRLADRLLRATEAIRQLEGAVRYRERQIDDLNRKINVGVRAEHVIAKTQELDPEEIRRHCTPVPLWESPLANPANIPPAWVRTEPTPAT